MKIAGVGWDLHGYHRDPEKHGLDEEDSWDYQGASRIKTPFDRKTNYKLNSTLGISLAGEAMEDMTSDQAYSDVPVIKNLSKADLQKVVQHYSSALEDFRKNNPYAQHYMHEGKAFLDKAQHLLSHPDMKFARLEYE